MAEQLEKSQRDAERISAILSEGKDLPSESEQSSVTNLMRSSLNSMMSLVQKQDTQLREKCLNTGKELDTEYEDQLESTTKLIRQVELACYKQNLRDTGRQVDLQKPLLTEIYDFTSNDYNESKIKVTDAKAVHEFDGEKTPTDLKAEEFLSQVVTVGRQSKLNEQGLRSLLMSKLTGGAKQIINAQIQLHKLVIDVLPFRDLVGMFEHTFCPMSHPRQANLQLQKLPKLAPGDTSFLKLMSTVTRLAKISTLEVEESHRDILFQTRALDSFLNCLQPKHKNLVISENQKRQLQGLSHLTLAGATEFLLQGIHHLEDSLNTQPLYNTSSVNKVMEEEEFNDTEDNSFGWDDEYINWVSRGRFRGRNRSGFSRSSRRPWGGTRGNPGNRGKNIYYQQQEYQNRGNYQNKGNFQSNRGNFQNNKGNFQSNRGNFQSTRGNFQNNRANFQNKGNNPIYGNRMGFNPHSYGIANYRCFLCGQSHSYTDSVCPYFGTPLQKTKCEKCLTGLHRTSLCLGSIQEAQEAFKKEMALEKTSFRGHTRGAHRGAHRGRMIYTPENNEEQEDHNDLQSYLEELQDTEN